MAKPITAGLRSDVSAKKTGILNQHKFTGIPGNGKEFKYDDGYEVPGYDVVYLPTTSVRFWATIYGFTSVMQD